jgi:hypothetical protein
MLVLSSADVSFLLPRLQYKRTRRSNTAADAIPTTSATTVECNVREIGVGSGVGGGVGLVQFSDVGGGFDISDSPAFMVTDVPTSPIAQAKVTFDVLSPRVISLWPLVPLLPIKRQPVKVAFAPSSTYTAPPSCIVKGSKRSSRDQKRRCILHGIQGTLTEAMLSWNLQLKAAKEPIMSIAPPWKWS